MYEKILYYGLDYVVILRESLIYCVFFVKVRIVESSNLCVFVLNFLFLCNSLFKFLILMDFQSKICEKYLFVKVYVRYSDWFYEKNVVIFYKFFNINLGIVFGIFILVSRL